MAAKKDTQLLTLILNAIDNLTPTVKEAGEKTGGGNKRRGRMLPRKTSG